MQISLHHLLTSFFMPDEAAASHGAGNLQLATAVLLFEVIRAAENTSEAERTQMLNILRK